MEIKNYFMLEIRIHGRGGQGSVTLAELLAEAAYYSGKFAQAFPNFGVERRGAPVTAYVRLADKFIRLRSQVYTPDFLIVQDAGLLDGVDVFAGAKNGAIILINTTKPASEFKAPKRVAVKTIAATELGTEILGRPIINTIMLGAFAKLSGLIKMSAVEKAIGERFDQELAQKNIEAAKKGFDLISKS